MQTVTSDVAAVPAQGFAVFFQSNKLFPALTPQQLEIIAENCAVERYQKGDTILLAGREYDTLCILYHGSADVILDSPDNQQRYTVAQLEAGTHFGEKGFMEMGSASANIVAADTLTVLMIKRDAARKLGIYENMIKSIAAAQADRMQQANSRHVDAIKIAYDRQVEQNSFGRFYIATIIIFAISSVIPDYSNESPSFQLMVRWAYLLPLFLTALYAIRQQNVPVSVFGITIVGWQKSLKESLLVIGALVPPIILFKILNAPADEIIFTWKTLDYYSPTQLAIYLISYVPHSAIQEFIARGVGQGSLQRFMPDAPFLKPIVIASLLFGILHLHLSVEAAVFTFLISLLFGYLYYRHKTLIGVVFIHFTLGVTATALGLI